MTTLTMPNTSKFPDAPADVRMLSMNAITVLPEQYQTRDNTDPKFVQKYLNDMVGKDGNGGQGPYGGWGGFQPALVYLLPDGRYILVGGFTRFQAYEKAVVNWNRLVKDKTKRLERIIPCRIVKGTETEALLASIADNRHPQHTGREFTKDDAFRAAEMLIRNEETRTYSDRWISALSGVSAPAIVRLRLRLSDEGAAALPQRVSRMDSHGNIIDYVPYRNKAGGRPAIHKMKSNSGFSATINSESVYLGTTREEAENRVDAILERSDQFGKALKSFSRFTVWAQWRGVSLDSLRPTLWYGKTCRGVPIVLLMADNDDALLAAVAKAEMARRKTASGFAVVVFDRMKVSSTAGRFLSLASETMPQIRFMNPDEFIVHFGGTSIDDDGAGGPETEAEGEPEE